MIDQGLVILPVSRRILRTSLLMLLISVTVGLLGPDLMADRVPVIADSEASRHIGEMVTVEGKVANVRTTSTNTTYLNFGLPYPRQTFTAVIFRSAARSFPNAHSWEGARLRVTGRIRLYKGEPEIVLEDPGQVEVVSSGN